jgi:hypothetical protein
MNISNTTFIKKIAVAMLNNPIFFDQEENLQFLYAQPANYIAYLDFFNKNKIELLKNFSRKETNYKLGTVEDFSIDAIDINSPIDFFNYRNFSYTYKNDVLKTKGTLKVPGVLPFIKDDYNSIFQEYIWNLSLWPFVPFFIYTDLDPINLGGPLFLTSFTIDSKANSPVDINLSFEGGTTIPESYKSKTASYLSSFSRYLPQNIDFSETETQKTYRYSKSHDCFLTINVIEAEPEQEQNIAEKHNNDINWMSGQDFFITSMSLKVENSVDTVYTANDGITKNLLDGPKSIGLKKRTVTGSITFEAARDFSAIYNGINPGAISLVMYFGGPFYYPMKNVIFQNFDSKLNSGSSTYLHSIKFFALAQPTNLSKWYEQNEFDLDIQSIFFEGTFDGTLKTNPQQVTTNAEEEESDDNLQVPGWLAPPPSPVIASPNPFPPVFFPPIRPNLPNELN